jgi:hypothetical protein
MPAGRFSTSKQPRQAVSEVVLLHMPYKRGSGRKETRAAIVGQVVCGSGVVGEGTSASRFDLSFQDDKKEQIEPNDDRQSEIWL